MYVTSKFIKVQVASGDLLKVCQNIVALPTEQHCKHTANAAQQLTRAPRQTSTPFFALLVSFASNHTLHKMVDKLARLQQKVFPCVFNDTFT
jgi:hypothetical protein